MSGATAAYPGEEWPVGGLMSDVVKFWFVYRGISSIRNNSDKK